MITTPLNDRLLNDCGDVEKLAVSTRHNLVTSQGIR